MEEERNTNEEKEKEKEDEKVQSLSLFCLAVDTLTERLLLCSRSSYQRVFSLTFSLDSLICCMSWLSHFVSCWTHHC